jgi:hypothetical protein
MPLFDFVGASSNTANVAGTAAVSLTEAGVTFTLTTTAGDGTNNSSIGGGFAQFSSSGNTGTPVEAFVLDVTGPGQTRFDDTIQFSVTSLNGSWTVNGQAVNSGLNTLAGPQASLVFTPSTGNTNGFMWITSIDATINCFAPDTRISTPVGPRRVQDLEPGDRICTATGGVTTVQWLGIQPVDVRLMHPAKVNPIRITAGALGGGLPERDLLISQDHAIAIDGMLINAGALVNGTTIRQERGKMPDGFAYYHVETQAHELLLAEGVAAESFIDYAGRDSFDKGGEAEPRAIPEMDLPRVSSSRLVPGHIRDRLAPMPVAAE